MDCSYSSPGTLDEISYVSLCVKYQGRWVLAHHARRGSWEPPGGHVEPGEDAFDAAVRELYEETGAVDFEIIPAYDYRHYDQNGIFKNNGRTYLVEIHSLAPLPDQSEMDAAGDFQIEEFPTPLTYDRETIIRNFSRAERLARVGARRVYQSGSYRYDRVYTRIDVLAREIDTMLLKNPDDMERRCGYVHLYGVGLMASLIALRRGQDLRYAELAEMAGLLHDYASYAEHLPHEAAADHAHLGEPMVRALLERLALTSPEETDMLCAAVFHHSDKHCIDSEFDEILKDTDVMQHWLRNPMEPMFRDKDRAAALSLEFGLNV